ncbi:magnesium-dependent phosphatase-1 [Myxozyma melibiosi]|uniref:Magnesium-dependent phosphatase-1 n=1 Tax=Myxozyma melibiosi TaxID=54550 RepID=A0ABR1F2E6_9ASCO
MAASSSKNDLPKLFVYDLDYTLWRCWCDTHITPPIKAHPTEPGTAIKDRYGSEMAFYPDVPGIIADLSSTKNVQIAAASRTHAPDLARAMLSLLHIDGRRAIDHFSVLEIYPDSKITHFKALHEKTGIAYADMIFFDDESRNKEVERKLGVKFVLVRNGLSRKLHDRAVAEWRRERRV